MKVFAVLGMHRSATSLIAKGLHEAGVHMGDDLVGATRHQAHGHYEDRELVAMNEILLLSADGAWDRPPSAKRMEDLASDPQVRDYCTAYIDKRSDRDMWGMKDPRLVLTWPIWKPLLPGDVHEVMVWRSVDQIAASLHRRDRYGLDLGRRLARIYHERMGAMCT